MCEKDAQAKRGQPVEHRLHRRMSAAWSDQRKPRIGTFSMRSKCSSSSTKGLANRADVLADVVTVAPALHDRNRSS